MNATSTITYSEFSDFVRAFNQDALIVSVARIGSSLPDNAEELPFRITPPWALAGIVKASIAHGNRHRRRIATDDDIRRACQMYNNLNPELSQPDLADGFGILARMAYEQFPLQESIFEEMARAELFFTDYSGRRQLEVVSDATMSQLLGATPRAAVEIALILYASAKTNDGFFDPAWPDQPNFAKVLELVARDEILSVIDSVMAIDLATFKAQVEATKQLPYLDRYLFNPLHARPLLRMPDGRLLAPIPHLVGRRLSPIELYYDGLKRWDVAFTHDLGELLEDYIGRQFGTLPDAAVHPEVVFTKRKQEYKSTDWFVIFDEMVLIVEAKARRAMAAVRAADATAKADYKTTLGKAFDQINRTYDLLQQNLPEFQHIPTDRPILGLVATLDPWYIANSMARPLLPATKVPVMVASVREIEHLVGIGQRRSVGGVLTEIMNPSEVRQYWELGVALGPFDAPNDRNPLLDDAWSRLVFDDLEEV
ncbi:hypothetical protein [Hamadaea tsunoensis]|uniref:hypothetical protein n=1 Tax=Hamadaea tsunoensis TaxID=53368 RepID=UPI00041B1889|nr:hypothetical protein [Hamadaea tsunoensis]